MSTSADRENQHLLYAQPMNMGHRIALRLKELNWKQADLLDKVPELSPGTLSAMIKRDSKRSEFTSQIAKALRCSVDWLATGIGPKDQGSSTKIMVDPSQVASIVRFVPLISAIQAGMWTEIVDHLAPGDAEEMIACHKNIGKHGFALKIKGKSMEPDFKEGDLVLIDPDLQPNPGDFVVAKNSEEEATFKRYRPRGMNDKGEFYFELVPLNEDFETMRSDRQSIQIIGVAIDHIRSLR